MKILEEIKLPVKQDIEQFEAYFQHNLDSSIPLLNTIVRYTIRHKGKQIRPLLVFLTAKTFGEINRSTYNAAAFIELLHTATLIHDDVVDESYERRNHLSINAIWKTKIAVLVGDYFLSRGLLLSVREKEYDMLETISRAVKEMSEGELLQMQTSRKLIIDIDNYFKIISKKTASLIKASTVTGAQSVTRDETILNQMHDFGEAIGIAFQIKDDIFDYQKKGSIGKPIGNDIKEKKFTLPLILALQKVSVAKRNHIIRLLNFDRKSQETIEEITSFVVEQGGIEEAEQYLNQYRSKALNILSQFNENQANISLKKLVDYIILRDK
ncbi:MAG: polyprenyl synthetase family protein [Bacteroidales bacterium]|nr:polyprenyl synthetase family protein [Bacteroidales bacterium]HOK98334.1 polyprenyl synthetase family protein [Bacteroidales bacterium]HPO65201.1 polyprenyl synthetase family protein [Bacteroidales bacterium]